MKKIGILFGVENSFPSALVERINARNSGGIQAEFVQIGAVNLATAPRYAVIIDRISHDVPFYRAFLKQAALNGTVVINNPFWASADDKFFNYTLAARLGVAVPPTVLLPHKELPNATSPKSMRNLEYPLDWDGVFAAIGERGFLKPINGGGWRDVQEVRSREEFFRAYDQSRDLCMVYQKTVEFTEYFRCIVVAQKKVCIMSYDPRLPHAERYQRSAGRTNTFHARKLHNRMEEDALKLCRVLGYDLNSVEFAVENGIPYAIDFLNPVPDADIHSVGEKNFAWIVEHVAEMAIAKAKNAPKVPEMRWHAMLNAASAKSRAKQKSVSKKPARPRVEPKGPGSAVEATPAPLSE